MLLSSNGDNDDIIKAESDEVSDNYHINSPEVSLHAIVGTYTSKNENHRSLEQASRCGISGFQEYS